MYKIFAFIIMHVSRAETISWSIDNQKLNF